MTLPNSGSGRRPAASPPASGNRLPSSRERRPALAALAVLLIAGGAVLAGWLALRQGQTTSYLAIRDQVWSGEQIERSDLRAVDFPSDTKVDLIPTSKVGQVIGSYALTDLPEGNVLTSGQIADHPSIPAHSSRVGLSLEPGQAPMELHVGQDVTVVVLRGTGTSDRPVGTATAVVTAVKNLTSTNGGQVDVLVSDRCQDTLTAAAAKGHVSVSALPAAKGAPTLTCSTSIQDPDRQVVSSEEGPSGKHDAKKKGSHKR